MNKLIKRLFCKHNYEHFFLTKDVKCGEFVFKNGLLTGSKWHCIKCGKCKYYNSGM
jgi:hypothetical protein